MAKTTACTKEDDEVTDLSPRVIDDTIESGVSSQDGGFRQFEVMWDRRYVVYVGHDAVLEGAIDSVSRRVSLTITCIQPLFQIQNMHY
jgi:hypothetical protein